MSRDGEQRPRTLLGASDPSEQPDPGRKLMEGGEPRSLHHSAEREATRQAGRARHLRRATDRATTQHQRMHDAPHPVGEVRERGEKVVLEAGHTKRCMPRAAGARVASSRSRAAQSIIACPPGQWHRRSLSTLDLTTACDRLAIVCFRPHRHSPASPGALMRRAAPVRAIADVPAREARRVVCILVDGARHDVLRDLLEQGDLPNLARWVIEPGGMAVGTTVFPSTTGVAYIPILFGRYPWTADVPAIRWLDRGAAARGSGLRSQWRAARSYCGAQASWINR